MAFAYRNVDVAVVRLSGRLGGGLGGCRGLRV